MVLGTGLGGFDREVQVNARLPTTRSLASPPPARGVSARATSTLGTLGGRGVVLMEGRYHLYKGSRLEEIVFP